MKIKTKLLLTTLALGMSASLLVAQDATPPRSGERPPRPEGRGQGGPGREGQPPGPPMSPIIAALDLNSDGVIDADELAKATASLKKLDKNGDGKLTADEFRPQRPGGPGGPGGREGRPERGPGAREQGATPGRQRPAAE